MHGHYAIFFDVFLRGDNGVGVDGVSGVVEDVGGRRFIVFGRLDDVGEGVIFRFEQISSDARTFLLVTVEGTTYASPADVSSGMEAMRVGFRVVESCAGEYFPYFPIEL